MLTSLSRQAFGQSKNKAHQNGAGGAVLPRMVVSTHVQETAGSPAHRRAELEIASGITATTGSRRAAGHPHDGASRPRCKLLFRHRIDEMTSRRSGSSALGGSVIMRVTT